VGEEEASREREKKYLKTTRAGLGGWTEVRRVRNCVMSAEKAAVDMGVSGVEGDAEVQGFDAAQTKKLLRKLDWHIIPFMSLIYL
jgi:hypothetical protein